MADVSVLLGKTIVDVSNNSNEELIFKTSDGKMYKMYHDDEGSETVVIEDIVGNLTDLINSPVLMAEGVTQEDEATDESGTWTFYKFSTVKGYVTIRWYGSSNGHYSESVDFKEI